MGGKRKNCVVCQICSRNPEDRAFIEANNIALFDFPAPSDHRRAEWIEFAGKTEETLASFKSYSPSICSQHFSESSLKKEVKFTLRADAVPSIRQDREDRQSPPRPEPGTSTQDVQTTPIARRSTVERGTVISARRRAGKELLETTEKALKRRIKVLRKGNQKLRNDVKTLKTQMNKQKRQKKLTQSRNERRFNFLTKRQFTKVYFKKKRVNWDDKTMHQCIRWKALGARLYHTKEQEILREFLADQRVIQRLAHWPRKVHPISMRPL